MKKLSLQLTVSALLVLTLFFVADLAFAQVQIPNLQGTWQLSISGKDTSWNGQMEGMKDAGNLFIYQSSYEQNVPNLIAVPEDDPGDPFQGFVQRDQVSLYKNNQHGVPNLGREILVGKINKKGNVFAGKGVGFDSNPEWGGVWSYNFKAKKISDTIPTPVQTTYMMSCDRCDQDSGLCGTDPFYADYANYTVTFQSGIVGSIAAVGIEISSSGGTTAHLELRDQSSNVLAVSQNAATSSTGWIEFTFSPVFVIDRASLVLNFVADGNARAYNCANTVQFVPSGLTASGLGLEGHLARSYIKINN